ARVSEDSLASPEGAMVGAAIDAGPEVPASRSMRRPAGEPTEDTELIAMCHLVAFGCCKGYPDQR
ncbi:hypothetical protein BRN97_04655, partial [Xanthomonas oryzae pv. oryzae]